MPIFSRQNRLTFVLRIPFVSSGVRTCLFLGASFLFLSVANGAVRTSDIPVVSIPQNSGELHGFVNGLTATSGPKKTPYQSAIAAAEENLSGKILLASGNLPQKASVKINTETVKPSGSPALSFREPPSQVAPNPLGSVPFHGNVQSTRPIRSNTAQKAKPLNPNRIAPARYNVAESESPSEYPPDVMEEPRDDESVIAPADENYVENFDEIPGASEEIQSTGLETAEQPVGFLRRDPFGETAATEPQGDYAARQSAAIPYSEERDPENSDESDLLNKARPERKEKSGKLTFLPAESQLMPLLSVLGSLCLVLGAFFLFVLFMKKVGPKNGGHLPKEALENVGRYPLNQKLQLNLIRLGNRLILVAITPDGGVETISEIESQDEVSQILGLCRKLDPNSSQAQFKSVLDEFAQEKTPGGFFGPNDPKRKTNAAPTLSSLLAGGLKDNGGIYG